jgi:hypothetical protein
MATATTTIEHPRASHNQRLAWGVVWLAFALFCLLFAGSVIGVYFFLFDSTVPMQVTLNVSRGTAGVTGSDLLELVVRDQEWFVIPGNLITIPADAQGLLFLQDVRTEQAFISAVTLRSDTRAVISDAVRPRFDWSDQGYVAHLDQISGDFDILIPSGSTRSILLIMTTESGDAVYMTQAGRYAVSARRDTLEVVNFTGEALLVANDRVNTRAIPAGQRGILFMQSNAIESRPGFIDLLANNPSPSNGENGNPGALTSPEDWICFTTEQSQSPSGTYSFETLEGRDTVHLLRGDNATTHWETRCSQRLGPTTLGIDIGSYNYLGIRATFRINTSSLAVCGTAATECPLMFNMQYLTASSSEVVTGTRDPDAFGSLINPEGESALHNWYKGFFVVPAGQFASPLRCPSCVQEHSFIRAEQWYTYDSGNLLAVQTPDQLPRFLLNFSFYASGHQYDVYVSDVMLLVGNIDVPQG